MPYGSAHAWSAWRVCHPATLTVGPYGSTMGPMRYADAMCLPLGIPYCTQCDRPKSLAARDVVGQRDHDETGKRETETMTDFFVGARAARFGVHDRSRQTAYDK